MSSIPPRSSVALTLTVALATLCALGLPDGMGGRDSVVRLTRGGLQRMGCADTACHHDDPEARVESARELQPDADRVDGPPTVVIQPAPPAAPVPVAQPAIPSGLERRPRALAPPGHAVSGRAPPAR